MPRHPPIPQPKRAPRAQLIEVLDRPGHTVEVANRAGRTWPATHYMLLALQADGVVTRDREQRWNLTGNPLPERLTPVERRAKPRAAERAPVFDTSALEMALRHLAA